MVDGRYFTRCLTVFWDFLNKSTKSTSALRLHLTSNVNFQTNLAITDAYELTAPTWYYRHCRQTKDTPPTYPASCSASVAATPLGSWLSTDFLVGQQQQQRIMQRTRQPQRDEKISKDCENCIFHCELSRDGESVWVLAKGCKRETKRNTETVCSTSLQ